jgi:uncharacterized protein (DUF2147 family)
MQKMKLFLFVGILSLLFIGQLLAGEPEGNLTPEGYWKTIDDKTGEVKSIVKLWIAEDGTLKGRIEKIFPKEGEDPNPKCDKCKGDKKDQPVLGMEFLWGFQGAGAVWKNGKALDPENGKIYSCQLEVIENGKKLKVFGYIRIIFKIGRSQIWLREKESS